MQAASGCTVSLARSLARSEVVMAALLAAATAAALVAFAPPAGDEPAHLYRTLLVREGVLVWDNLWYAGHYPLASYSLLYYPLAALFGNVSLVFAAVVASAALFASIALREWGESARWGVRAFAVIACAPLFTGTYSYALGLAALLGSLRALQAGRAFPALLLATLTLAFSPLAFALLCLVILALALTRWPGWRNGAVLASGLGLLAGCQVAVALLVPFSGRYGFRVSELGLALAAAALGALVAGRAPRGGPFVALFLLWALSCVLAFAVPSPVGSTLTRFRDFLFPLALVGVFLPGVRPRWLAVGAAAGALVYSVGPHLTVATQLTDTRPAHASFWAPALEFLREHSSSDYRVDVVPTFDNWEAYFVPRAGFALARGWYRQLDLDRNPLLYQRTLSAGEYRRWLRHNGVRYVLLPDAPLDRLAAEPQAKLLRSGRSGLVEVYRSADWTIYELPGATPVLTGPAAARLTELGHERVAGWVGARGSYVLRIRSMPYWRVREGQVCVARSPDGMTRLQAKRPGRFVLAVAEGPGALLRAALRGDEGRCPRS